MCEVGGHPVVEPPEIHSNLLTLWVQEKVLHNPYTHKRETSVSRKEHNIFISYIFVYLRLKWGLWTTLQISKRNFNSIHNNFLEILDYLILTYTQISLHFVFNIDQWSDERDGKAFPAISWYPNSRKFLIQKLTSKFITMRWHPILLNNFIVAFNSWKSIEF